MTRKAWESHQCSWAEKKTSTCGPRRLRIYVSGEFSNVRGALTFAVESRDAVTATVALGLPEREAVMSTENDGQLFEVLSALRDGQSFDVVMSAAGDHGFESWRKLHRIWDQYTAGRARSLLREILSPTQLKLPELMRAIEKMEDLVETPLWSMRCPRKRAQSCGGCPHEFP